MTYDIGGVYEQERDIVLNDLANFTRSNGPSPACVPAGTFATPQPTC